MKNYTNIILEESNQPIIKRNLRHLFDIENIPYQTFLFAVALGVGISLPNILLQIIRRCKNQMTSAWYTLALNIIWHFAFGAFIIEFTGIFGLPNPEFDCSILLTGIYVIICFILFLIAICGGPRTYFDVLYNLCKSLEDSRTLQDVVSYNRKVPPKICVDAEASHQESREVWVEYEQYQRPVYETVTIYYSDGSASSHEKFSHYETDYRYKTTHYSAWGRVDNGGGRFHGTPGAYSSRYDKSVEYRTVVTWTKTTEYQYTSWQDETKDLSDIKYCSIVKTHFSFLIIFDPESRDFVDKIKSDLYREGKTHDTDVTTTENFTSPGMIFKHKCSLNDEEYQRIKKKFTNKCTYFWWIMLLLLGYSYMLDCFARYEIGSENVTIRKFVSYNEDCRADYMKNDENPPAITFNFIYTRIQQKRIEKKIKKGVLDEKALETPLIVIS